MRKIFAILLLLLTSLALTVNIESPNGEYSWGKIAVEANVQDADGFAEDASVTAVIQKTNYADSKTLKEYSGSYREYFDVNEAGTYTVTVRAAKDGEVATDTQTFTVKNSELFLLIKKPVERTYAEGKIEIEVELNTKTSFVNNAAVSAVVGGKTIDLPESQNSYRGVVELTAGEYTVSVTARSNAQTERASVDINVSGEVTEGGKTTFIPETRENTVLKISPTRAQYDLGTKEDITVRVMDYDNTVNAQANVTAFVKTPSNKLIDIPLIFKDDITNPRYSNSYVFAENGYYEIYVTAEQSGYKQTKEFFTPIKIGEEPPELSEQLDCYVGICLKIIKPEEITTYSLNDTIELRIQAVDEATTNPLNDGEVTATVNDQNYILNYDWNGMYYTTLTPMPEGNYEVRFTVIKGDKEHSISTNFYVSPHSIQITPIKPTKTQNVTNNFVLIEAQITDENGEVVTDANVRAIVSTPQTGHHTIVLTRNVETGNYESNYAFSNDGEYQLKIVASKIGYVGGETEYSFKVITEKEKEQPIVNEQDVLLVLMVAGALLILVTVGRALL